MKKLYSIIVNIFLIILLLAGCSLTEPLSGNDLSVESIPAVDNSVSLDGDITYADSTPVIKISIPYISVSLYAPEKKGYFTIGRIYNAEEVTLPVLLTITLQELDFDVVFRSVRLENGELTVDWCGPFAETIQKNPELETTVLNTVGETLLSYINSFHDVKSITHILYKVDGETYQSTNMIIENGLFIPFPHEFAELTAEEYAELRCQIPYPGLVADSDISSLEIICSDDTTRLLWNYLKYFQDPRKEFSSVDELDNNYIVSCAYGATPWTKDADFDLYGHINPYHKQLRFFSTNTSQCFKLKEHIEASELALFQRTVDETISGWMPEKGVYGPLHTAGGGLTVPIITGYEDLGTSYRVFAAYLVIDMWYYIINGTTYENLAYPQIDSELKKSLSTATPEREFIIDKKPDGSFLIRSHKYLND